jgi:predicted nucleic acid-binding protein
MEIAADASVFLAVVLNEDDRAWIIDKTAACVVVAPEILPYEIGNALVAVRRRGRLSDREVVRAFDLAQGITVRLLPVVIQDALELALRHGIYAYDAYYLQCCVEHGLPLLSLDGRMCDVARQLAVEVVE